jgi:hypothetical protein
VRIYSGLDILIIQVLRSDGSGHFDLEVAKVYGVAFKALLAVTSMLCLHHEMLNFACLLFL